MMVKAKCITPAWDSINAVRYEPGSGPLPEGLYEIDRDGPLAHMKLGSTYVFAFDRCVKTEDEPIIEQDEDEPDELSARTCNICDPPKVLKSAHGLNLHNQKSHPFQSQPVRSIAETAVPA